MCWAIRNELRENGFEWYETTKIVKVEFESLLEKMNVLTNGWLWLETWEERNARKWDSDPELREARVMFLLMLADAVAYKPNGGKRKNSLRPMSKFPSSVGVHVLKHENTDDHHFSYWNGQHWCYTCNDVESAIRLGKFHGKSPSVYDKNDVVNSCYVGWKTVDT
jgi:hypothetical protein